MRLLFVIAIFLTQIFAFTKVEVLSPEEAFKYDIKQNGDMLEVKLILGKNIYLYDEQLKFTLTKPKEQDLKPLLNLPNPKDYMEFMVYFDSIDTNISLKELGLDSEFSVNLAFQGCSKQGICYPPVSKEYSFKVEEKKDVAPQKTESFSNEQDEIAGMLKDKSLIATLISFFGFGLLLSLTPCIFPMIPILSSILVSQGEKVDAKRGFFISLVYVLSMAITYTIAGVMAGLFGSNIQAAFQNPWIIVSFSLIFVALSFSMFGFYDLELPQSLQTKLTKKSDEARGKGGLVGVAIMGLLSALIVGPCVAAPLAGALIYIGQTGDALLGGLALFVMSLGMGVPLLIIGLGAGKFMPRPGGWMDSVKTFFGVVLLGVAIWMLSRIVNIEITMLLSALLLIGTAVILGVFESINKVVKFVLIVSFIYGTALFVGVLGGSKDILKPLSVFVGGEVQKAEKVLFQRVSTLKQLEDIIATSTKPIFLDFYADWCTSCVELEHSTFKDTNVQKALQDFTTLQIDVTKNSEEDKKILKNFGLFGPPGLLFFSNSHEIKEARIVGYVEAKEFETHLKKILRISK